MSEHSSLVGGSSAARVIACPPSRLHAEGIPSTESEDSKRGSALHTCMEVAISDKREAKQFAGFQHPNGYTVTDDDVVALDAALSIWKLFASNQDIQTVALEQRGDIPQIPGAYGTADVVLQYVGANRIDIIDWKFGRGVLVGAVGNKQLLFYAATVWMLLRPGMDIGLHIVQPNDRNEPVLKTWRVSPTEVFDFIRELADAIELGDRDELLASGEHCRWCPVKPVCPKLKADAERALEWADPHDATAEQVAEMLHLTEQLEPWIKSVRAYAHECLEHSKEVPGYKLVPRRAMRKWASMGRAEAWAPNEAFETVLKSPAQVEKLGIEIPDDLIEARSSGTVVVPDSDPREAVASSAQLQGLSDQISKLNLK